MFIVYWFLFLYDGYPKRSVLVLHVGIFYENYNEPRNFLDTIVRGEGGFKENKTFLI